MSLDKPEKAGVIVDSKTSTIYAWLSEICQMKDPHGPQGSSLNVCLYVYKDTLRRVVLFEF